MNEASKGPDGKRRCHWANASPEFIAYHDQEWGYPVVEDRTLFEKLTLESFQSGLSWRTILAKREHFRRAFQQFDIDRIARFTRRDVERLLKDAGIVRHRGKIEATINNAQRAQQIRACEGSLAAFLWRHEPARRSPSTPGIAALTATNALSKELRRLGWRFVGPTTVYAFAQAMGLINDHARDCVVRARIERARRALKRPT